MTCVWKCYGLAYHIILNSVLEHFQLLGGTTPSKVVTMICEQWISNKDILKLIRSVDSGNACKGELTAKNYLPFQCFGHQCGSFLITDHKIGTTVE